MGEEFSSSHSYNDVESFIRSAEVETKILESWFRGGRLEDRDDCYGLELEGCLASKDCLPALKNQAFLDELRDPSFVPELAQFNFEYNAPIFYRNADMLEQILTNLNESTSKAYQAAVKLDLDPIWIGIFPTVKDDMLNLNTMTQMNRYRALATKVMELRNFDPLELQIEQVDSLSLSRQDIMTEAASTSVQIHTQIRPGNSARAYNAALIITAPCLALMANSPLLYGKKLWDETRIPLFEQSLAVPLVHQDQLEAVTIGSGYVEQSILELFQENLTKHRPIFPVTFDDVPEKLRHLRFFNGQVWRWVRPILGMDSEGKAHIRLEQRAFSAGPSNVDTVANMAFYIGLLQYYSVLAEPLEHEIPFSMCKENFYACARNGLQATVWWNRGEVSVRKLLLESLLEKARLGLENLNFQKSDIEYFLGDIIQNRILTGQNGANWQKGFFDTHGGDLQVLTKAYIENQKSGLPVYQWKKS